MLPPQLDREAPDYVMEVLAEHAATRLQFLHGPESLPASGHQEPVLISVVKNECDRLPDFLRHYRERGIERFLLIDNGSSDGTIELLSSQLDCTVFQIIAPFDWRKKHGWITLAIDMIGRGRDQWYMYADADEHIVFAGMNNLSFGDLARTMERRGITRVRGMLIDMYREGPLLGSTYEPGTALISAYPYFDSGGYKEERYREIISRKGGPRQRVFGRADPKFRPEMTKYPLFKLSGYDVFANPHHIWPYEPNFYSPCVLGILHFKFLPDTIRRIDEAIKAENYWGGSMEYKCYKRVMSKEPRLSLFGDASQRYVGVDSLTEHHLISAPQFIDSLDEK